MYLAHLFFYCHFNTKRINFTLFLLILFATDPERSVTKIPPPTLQKLPQAEVLYDFKVEDTDEISLLAGQTIYILKEGMIYTFIKITHIYEYND